MRQWGGGCRRRAQGTAGGREGQGTPATLQKNSHTELPGPPGLGPNELWSLTGPHARASPLPLLPRGTLRGHQDSGGFTTSSVPHSQWQPSRGCPGNRCGLGPPPTVALRTVRGLIGQQRAARTRSLMQPPGGPEWALCSDPVTSWPGLSGSPCPLLCPTDSQVASSPQHGSPTRQARVAST